MLPELFPHSCNRYEIWKNRIAIGVSLATAPLPHGPLWHSPSLFPCHLEDGVPELPPSIKIRDFAYESRYWHSICGLQAECAGSPRDPPSSPSSAGASGPGVEGSTRTSGCMKRRRESDEEQPLSWRDCPLEKGLGLTDRLQSDRSRCVAWWWWDCSKRKRVT
jgi:hypothetical protein